MTALAVHAEDTVRGCIDQSPETFLACLQVCGHLAAFVDVADKAQLAILYNLDSGYRHPSLLTGLENEPDFQINAPDSFNRCSSKHALLF